MVRLKKEYNIFVESKQDEEMLKAYLGLDLFCQYMDIRKRLPNLNNQFKDFTKVSFDTGNKNKDLELKKDLVSSYNRLLKYLPKNKQSFYNPLIDINVSSLVDSDLEEILDAYNEVRDIVFKDQARFRDFSQLVKQPIEDIENWIDSFSTNRSKKQQNKVEGACKLYEDSDWVVYRITTYPAAQLYGSNTKWCIAGKYPNHEGKGEQYFNNYIRDNNLDGGYYFYISKKDPSKKYCVLQRNDKTIHSVWDASDTKLGSSYDELGISLPDVKEVTFPKYSASGLINEINNGDLEKVKEYINSGFSVNGDFNGIPFLHEALYCGKYNIAKYLIDNGANVDIKDLEGNTALYVLSHLNNASGVSFLLRYGANPDIKCIYGDTPLHISCLDGNDDIFKILLENGATPLTRNNKNLSVVDIALENENTSILKTLFKYIDVDPVEITKTRSIPVIDALLDSGVDIDTQDPFCFTCLHHACEKGNLKLVKFLVEHGADLNIESVCGYPINLCWPTKEGISIAKYLINKGADLHRANSESQIEPLLHMAIKSGDSDFVNLILKEGIDPNVKDSKCRTPLHVACDKGLSDIIRLLVDKGAKPNIKDKSGRTAIDIAEDNKLFDVVSYLKDSSSKL